MVRILRTHTLAELVGENLHRLRANYSMTEFVTVAREYGATWSTSSISAIERGNANVTIEGLALMQVTLSNLLDRPVHINELLGYDPNYNPNEHLNDYWDEETGARILHIAENYWGMEKLVQWSKNSYIFVSDVAAWFENQDPEALAEAIKNAQRFVNRHTSLSAKVSPPVTPGEERIANKLGVTAKQLQEWSQELWGEAIEAHRDRLAGEGASPQKKGRVTGKLLTEIHQAQEEGRLGNGQ